jgi:hypothetical protein
MDDDERRKEKYRPEELKDVLNVVSTEIPGMIKSILSSVFSEEAGKNMGKAAAAYYKELKEGGLPESVAVKMTEDYMKTFTNLSEMLRSTGGHGHGRDDEWSKDIERRVHDKIREKMQKPEEEEEE